MATPVALIATARLSPATMAAFTAWQARHEAAAAAYPGFLSSDLIPPAVPGHDEWTLILSFQSEAELKAWQASPQRAALLAAGQAFFAHGNDGQVLIGASAQDGAVTGVTGMIFSRIKPGTEARYRDWSVRIQAAQAQYPGYRGMYLQPPAAGSSQATWTTLVRYDTAEHLEAWMSSPERAAMLREAEAFVDDSELVRLATAFPGWVPVDPATGQGPPSWQTALLVQLGLFPIVMLELRYLNPVFAAWGWNTALATFVSLALSVGASSYLTMPLGVRGFAWWLFPKVPPGRTALRGTLLLIGLFVVEVGALWWLLP